MEISSILPIISAVVAIFSIPASLQLFHQHKRKKFKDELENFTEYFEKFYKNTNSEYTRLLRDKAAQNLTRTPTISAEVVDYFIDLHEQRLANFDELIDHYYWGNKYIYVKVIDYHIYFSKKSYTSNLFQKFYYFSYFLMAFFSGLLFLDIINLSNVSWFDSMVGFASLICAIYSLNKADDMREVLSFLKLINIAEEKNQNKIHTNSSIDLAS